jgi:hypothetical protein
MVRRIAPGSGGGYAASQLNPVQYLSQSLADDELPRTQSEPVIRVLDGP